MLLARLDLYLLWCAISEIKWESFCGLESGEKCSLEDIPRAVVFILGTAYMSFSPVFPSFARQTEKYCFS